MGNFTSMPAFIRNIILLLLMVDFSSGHSQTSINIPLKLELENLNNDDAIELLIQGDLMVIQDFVLNNGGAFRRTHSNFATIHLKKKWIEKLAKQQGVQHIFREFGSQGALLNDSMLVNNNILPIHSSKLFNGNSFKGKDVLLGFIDTGIDYTHPDFQDSTGNTRIIKIWDQAADTIISSRVPQPYNYGQVWDQNSIDSKISSHDDDILSHGTNVAGIACGNGLAVGKYLGVAPEASIVMVATDFSASNWLNTVADGVEYIFNIADSLNIPCVINISAGVYTGSHDGLDPAAIRIDSLIKSANGRALVCAAGNLGNLPFHLGYAVTSDTNFTWFKHNSSFNGLYYEIWADTADFNNVEFSFGIDRVTPNYSFLTQTPFKNIQGTLNTIVFDTLTNGIHTFATVQTYAEHLNGRYVLQVYIPSPDSSQYNFRLSLTGNGNFDLWSHPSIGFSAMIADNLPTAANFPDIVNYKLPDTLKTVVGSFASLASVITVGNYINRDRYVDVNNLLQIDTALFGEDLIPGNIARNSCTGPTRLNIIKPDISASGDITVTANRLASIPLHITNNQANRIGEGGMHKRNGGTSMAAPVVAGLAALYFEKCPKTNYLELKDAIISTAASDTFTSNLPSNKWGYGKLNGTAALQSTNLKAKMTPNIDQEICMGDSVIFMAQGGVIKYSWFDMDSANSRISVIKEDVFYQAEDSNGCLIYSDTIAVYVNPIPSKPNLLMSGDSLITNHVFLNYNWYRNDTLVTGEHLNYLIPSQDGEYKVEIIDSNNCTNFSDNLNVEWVFIKELDRDKSILLYPNPANKSFTVESNYGNTLELLKITDSYGREVRYEIENHKNCLKIKLVNRNPGIYFIQLKSENQLFIKKLMLK